MRIEEIEKACEIISKQSLELFSFQMETDITVVESLFVRIFHQESRDYMEVNKHSKIHTEILGQGNLWKILRLRRYDKIRLEVNLISKAYTNSFLTIPINHSYIHINVFGKMMKLFPEKISQYRSDDPIKSLGEHIWIVLLNLPRVEYFTSNFNAFISGESNVYGLPALCYYNNTMSVVESMASNLCLLILDCRKEEINTYDFEEINDRINLFPKVFQYIDQCFESLISRSVLSIAPDLFLFNDNEYVQMEVIRELSSSFIVYHEYGHFLLGHSEYKISKELEYHADYWSSIVLKFAFGEQYKLHIAAAQSIVLILMDIRENSLEVKHDQHPSAFERFNKIKIHDDKETSLFRDRFGKRVYHILNLYFLFKTKKHG